LKLAVFSTGPAIRNTAANLISETLGTMMLILAIGAIVSKAVGGIAPGMIPFMVGGAVWAIGMAVGVVFISLTPGYNEDLMSYLFGSILAVPVSDLWQMGAIGAGVILIVTWYYNDFLAMSYDDEFARLRNVPVTFLYCLLLGMIAVTVVIIIRVVGLILVIALLTIPPFIAEKFTSSLRTMMVASSVLSCLFTLTGLWFSYLLNLTSGATIILVAAAGFILADLWGRLRTMRSPDQIRATGNAE
jgi:zinc transport system permease protein